jgi:AcrR family transcriptional regulator
VSPKCQTWWPRVADHQPAEDPAGDHRQTVLVSAVLRDALDPQQRLVLLSPGHATSEQCMLKQALLEAVVDRLADAVAASLAPMVERSDVTALDKLGRFFAALATWKTGWRDLLVALLRVWQSDDNAIARQKLRHGIVDRSAPLLAGIVDQGVREGVFTAVYPEQTARVIVSLVQDLNHRLATLFLATETGQGDWPTVEHTVTAYTDALARVLGAPAGSVVLVDPDVLRRWFEPEHGLDHNESGEQ